MKLRPLLMDGVKLVADLSFNELLSATRDKAIKKQGYNVTFEGEYKQAPKGQPKTQIRVPFIIAQSNDQKAELSEGVLEGKVYDAGRIAEIHGSINKGHVEFSKLYYKKSVKPTKKVQRIIKVIDTVLKAVGEKPPTVGSSHIGNPPVITYKGTRVMPLDEVVYSGRWSFNLNNEDMESRGQFSMRATDRYVRNAIDR